ncbi:MAG TPA: FHA domain-containing protein [Pyrinomonadaceae bacterium]
MSLDEVVRISHDELYRANVDSTLAHQKALVRQSEPIVEQPVSGLRRVLLSNLFYTPLAGLLGGLTTSLILEPLVTDTPEGMDGPWWLIFPLASTLTVLFIFISDGIASRRLRGNVARWLRGTGFTLLFSSLAIIPVAIIFIIGLSILSVLTDAPSGDGFVPVKDVSASFFIGYIIIRSLGWAIYGAALGWGMNLMRSTPAQRRASVMGGMVGGVLGGLLFDPINRFLFPSVEEGSIMRLAGLCAIGGCVGIFVALSERLGRAGWVRVRTGPLRGKAFIIYHNPTIIGSSPQATIYLFKDAKIAPKHAELHRVGSGYELVEVGSDSPISINGRPAHRQRLASGDQIIIGDTILDFEERAKTRPLPNATIKEAAI